MRLKVAFAHLYRWIFGMGDMVEIVGLEGFLWATSDAWGKDSPPKKSSWKITRQRGTASSRCSIRSKKSTGIKLASRIHIARLV